MSTPEHAESSKRSFDARIMGVAAGQYGVFSRSQAVALGATKSMIQHRLDAGRWERLSRDAFRVSGALPSWRQEVLAACFAWGDGAVASHLGAAPLWNLSRFDEGPIELNVPVGRYRDAPGVVHRNVLLPSDATTVHGIPVTSADRTFLDLAGVASRDAIEEALDDALRRGTVRIPRLQWRLKQEKHSRRSGVATLRSLIDARVNGGPVPQSVLETKLLRTLKQAGLPEPVRQYKLRCGSGRIVYIDFAYPDQRVAIEADGHRWHSGRAQWERDLARRNDLTLMHWRIIHVTWWNLINHPAAVVTEVKEALSTSRP